MHSKKIVSFSDNIDEQLKQAAESVTLVASNVAIDNEQKEAEMPPPPNKWFRSLSYDNANDQSLKEEEIRNHDLPEAKTKPNESTPKQNSNSIKSPVSMASKYQSVLSINNRDENLDADKMLKCKQQNRRSTSLDWSSRKKLNQDNKNNLENKVASSAKITVFKKSESEEKPDFYRLQNENNNSKLNTSQSSKIFNLDAVKNVLLSAKSKALNLSNNNTSNTSYKEKVLNNSILNNIKSSLNKSPNKAQDDELQQTLLDNVEIKREESGEQILPQSKE